MSFATYCMLSIILLYSAVSIEAVRLRFILVNQTNNNLYACLSTHECNPLLQAVMPPNTNENIFTNNFGSQVNTFIFNLKTNNETTNYTVFYNCRAKTIQLQREGIIFDEITYNAEKNMYPVIIVIDNKLDAYFDIEALVNRDIDTGMNRVNDRGYKPSTYLGDSGPKTIRKDKNRFCPKHSVCRNDTASLASYVGRGTVAKVHDNPRPFCHEHSCRCKK